MYLISQLTKMIPMISSILKERRTEGSSTRDFCWCELRKQKHIIRVRRERTKRSKSIRDILKKFPTELVET